MIVLSSPTLGKDEAETVWYCFARSSTRCWSWARVAMTVKTLAFIFGILSAMDMISVGWQWASNKPTFLAACMLLLSILISWKAGDFEIDCFYLLDRSARGEGYDWCGCISSFQTLLMHNNVILFWAHDLRLSLVERQGCDSRLIRVNLKGSYVFESKSATQACQSNALIRTASAASGWSIRRLAVSVCQQFHLVSRSTTISSRRPSDHGHRWLDTIAIDRAVVWRSVEDVLRKRTAILQAQNLWAPV